MPKTFKFLQTKSIKVISARSDFEKKFPGETKRWKREAFVEISKKYYYTVVGSHLDQDEYRMLGRFEHRDGGSQAIRRVEFIK